MIEGTQIVGKKKLHSWSIWWKVEYGPHTKMDSGREGRRWERDKHFFLL